MLSHWDSAIASLKTEGVWNSPLQRQGSRLLGVPLGKHPLIPPFCGFCLGFVSLDFSIWYLTNIPKQYSKHNWFAQCPKIMWASASLARQASERSQQDSDTWLQLSEDISCTWLGVCTSKFSHLTQQSSASVNFYLFEHLIFAISFPLHCPVCDPLLL